MYTNISLWNYIFRQIGPRVCERVKKQFNYSLIAYQKFYYIFPNLLDFIQQRYRRKNNIKEEPISTASSTSAANDNINSLLGQLTPFQGINGLNNILSEQSSGIHQITTPQQNFFQQLQLLTTGTSLLQQSSNWQNHIVQQKLSIIILTKCIIFVFSTLCSWSFHSIPTHNWHNHNYHPRHKITSENILNSIFTSIICYAWISSVVYFLIMFYILEDHFRIPLIYYCSLLYYYPQMPLTLSFFNWYFLPIPSI